MLWPGKASRGEMVQFEFEGVPDEPRGLTEQGAEHLGWYLVHIKDNSPARHRQLHQTDMSKEWIKRRRLEVHPNQRLSLECA